MFNMTPEILNNRVRTQKSDIYSFGILCWEIITQRKVFASNRHDKMLDLKIIRGLRPKIEEIFHEF